ncbi:hypothetical protein B0H11DRAFT_2235012 [Mycena galericulata]|nr:hypothetical protein B0H11DRAFT_2235012 [Mycena galericulata]
MTQHSSLAPAASTLAVAGGRRTDLTVALNDLNSAVVSFTSAASRLAETPLSDIYSVIWRPMWQRKPWPTPPPTPPPACNRRRPRRLEDTTPTATVVATPAAVTSAPGVSSLIRTAGPWIAGELYGVIPLHALAAVPDNGEKWFAITRGKYVGLTTNSAISINAVSGVPGSICHKKNNQAEALVYFNEALAIGAVAVAQ